MTIPLLDIPVILGLSIEVYGILIILGIPTFFFWRLLFKKYIKVDKTRKLWTWLATILFTPCVYVGIGLLWFFSDSYYPNHDFDKQNWLADKDKRYEFSDKLIRSKILIGQSKADVRKFLGNDAGNQDTLNLWDFELGFKPGIGNLDPSYLHIEFKDDKVVNVGQTK